MKLRAIIVDDEFKGVNSLHILIDRYCPDVKAVAETTKASEAIELIESYLPDIVFLDINMPEMNGFELLSKLSWRNFNLIFTTAHQEYALEAIKSNAIDYLLKPVDPDELQLAVNKVKTRKNNSEPAVDFMKYLEVLRDLANKGRNKLIINSKNGIESIDLHDIICLESKSNYTQLNLIDSKVILTSKTLKEFEQTLCFNGSNFMRVHNSFIINLSKVSRYMKLTENIIMADELNIPVSKSRKDEFIDWLKI